MERPLTENAKRGGGCFQSGPSREKQGIWELKITKKRIFFFKRRSFRSAEVGKAEQRMVYFKKKGSLVVAYVERVE